MMPTTPSGWYMILAEAGRKAQPTCRRSGIIHAERWLSVWRTHSTATKISAASVSCRERLPKSCETASMMAALLSSSSRSSARSDVTRSA